ncbi:MAG: TetR/AcrR family transcriptional regulator, partial [Hyphomicrobiaceae bacterium]
SQELGLIRGTSAFSPALRKIEAEFEGIRYQMQEERIRALFAQARARCGLDPEQARRILWMYTSRDVYRMLVQDGGWSAQRYQEWLSRTLVEALVEPVSGAKR